MRAWFALGILLLTLGSQQAVLHHMGEHYHQHETSKVVHSHDHGDHSHSHSNGHDHPDQDHELPLVLYKNITVCCLPVSPKITKVTLHLEAANGWRIQGAQWVPLKHLYDRGPSRAPPLSFVC